MCDSDFNTSTDLAALDPRDLPFSILTLTPCIASLSPNELGRSRGSTRATFSLSRFDQPRTAEYRPDVESPASRLQKPDTQFCRGVGRSLAASTRRTFGREGLVQATRRTVPKPNRIAAHVYCGWSSCRSVPVVSGYPENGLSVCANIVIRRHGARQIRFALSRHTARPFNRLLQRAPAGCRECQSVSFPVSDESVRPSR